MRRNARQLNVMAHKHNVTPEINVQPIKHFNYNEYDEPKLKDITQFSEFADFLPNHKINGLSVRTMYNTARLQNTWRQSPAMKGSDHPDQLSGTGYSHVVEIGKSFGPPRKLLKDGSLSLEYDRRFNSKILQSDYRTSVFSKGVMAGFRVTVAVGNGNGLLGIGITFHPKYQDALKEAKQFAYQQLVHFPMLENGGIPYAVRGRYHRTELHAIPGSFGMDNKAQRTIKDLLDLAGFKHVGVKVFGRSTPESLCKAFMVTFQNFETHQEQADRLGRYAVKFDPTTYFKPEVLAEPSDPSNPVPYSAELHPSSQALFKAPKVVESMQEIEETK